MVHSALDVCPPTDDENIHFQKSYISSIVAINKAIEFMLLMFSFALASNFKAGLVVLIETIGIGIPHGKIDFHIFIMSISWLGVIIMFLAYLFNAVKVMAKKFKHIFTVLAILHTSGAILILITTVIILDNVIAFRNERIVKIPHRRFCDVVIGCSSYEGAGATSFFAIIFVSFDAVLHIIKAIQVYRDRQIEEEEAADDDGQCDTNQSFESHEPQLV